MACWLQVTTLTMAKGLQSAFLHPMSCIKWPDLPAPWSQPPSHSLQLMSIIRGRCGCTSTAWYLILSMGSLLGSSLWRQLRCNCNSTCLISSGSCSNNLKFNSPKQRTPNLEPSLLVYGVQSQAGIPPILPRKWNRNGNFEAGPGSCSPYKKLNAKPSMSQSTALPPSDSAISVRNLKRHILALPNIPAA